MQATLLIIGTWSMCTLLNNLMADTPERRTALIAKEFVRYNIDIGGMSEICLANKDQLTEIGGGYTFFWDSCDCDYGCNAGIGFTIKNHLVWKLISLSKDVNNWLMTLQLLLQNKSQVTLISAYAPTMTNPDEMKDGYYEELDTLLSAVSRMNKLILLGNF